MKTHSLASAIGRSPSESPPRRKPGIRQGAGGTLRSAPMSADLRRHWTLDPDLVFLNHGSFGATPRAVLDHQQALRSEMERSPVRFLWNRLPERLDAARQELAGFLKAPPEGLAFVTNATSAVNAIVRSVDLRPGDEILTTDHAYNACLCTLEAAAARHSARVITARVPFPLDDPGSIVEAILAGVTPRTRLALIDHVTSPTALVLPIHRIVRELESRGIDTLVDGAHAPGMTDLDLSELRPAWYTGNLHKWVCAPKGAAFLWAREDHREKLLPPVISHGWNTPRPGSTRYHDLFDWTGTFDPTAWLAVPEAIRFIGSLDPDGWPGVRRKNRELLLAARRELLSMLSLEAPCPESMLGSLATLPLPLALRLPGLPSPDPLQVRLYEIHRTEIPVMPFGGERWLRISAHLHNSPDDYRHLAAALQSEAAA